MAHGTAHREEHVCDALHVDGVTEHREEHVKQGIPRSLCYSTPGRTYKVRHYTWPVLQHMGRTCKAMQYTWLVVQHTGKTM